MGIYNIRGYSAKHTALCSLCSFGLWLLWGIPLVWFLVFICTDGFHWGALAGLLLWMFITFALGFPIAIWLVALFQGASWNDIEGGWKENRQLQGDIHTAFSSPAALGVFMLAPLAAIVTPFVLIVGIILTIIKMRQ
jgi:hypothetical protein